MPSKARKSNASGNVSKAPSSKDTSKHMHQPALAPPNPGSNSNIKPTTNGENMSSKTELDLKAGDTTESAEELESKPATTVNRKKQKRREKEAAKRATEQSFRPPANGRQIMDAFAQADTGMRIIESRTSVRQGRGPAKGYFTEEPDYVDSQDPSFHDIGSPDDAFYSGDEDPHYAKNSAGSSRSSWLNTNKPKKGSKTKMQSLSPSNLSRTSTAVARPPLPPLSNAALRSAHKMGDQIWNTSTQAERENIKQFWLELGEDERRSLVKVEKEAVLRKMKEQQKHSCSCSVCGRKRTAIEEELEVLYDAYYEELEQFANHNNDLSNPPQMIAPLRPPFRRKPPPMAGSYPSRGRVHEIGDDDEDLDDEDEEYDEDDEEAFSDEEDDDIENTGLPPGPPDFFQFGNSLTVKGKQNQPFFCQHTDKTIDGILTVADDLLKNDGKHFIDMMEQLAERRMQREEEIHYPSSTLAHQDLHQGHNHPPLDDEDDFDDEDDDEEYDSQEDDDDYEGDEMDSMTEEQRMEEGRRMFQIFAARMFEQRVLTAYREKVAAERQRKLLEELEEEDRLDTQREAKRAREAAKKKEKKKLQKQMKEEEKAKKDAEKAAQEAAVREIEERKLEEQRQRKEEQRRKREAERKAADEERLRKEAEKQKRAQEERERQAETERKQREAKERERKKREDARKKEREDREAKEKEVRERKVKEERERKAKDEQARKEKETASKTERDAKDRAAHTHSSRAQPVALPPGLHPPPPRGPQLQSPNFQVATPVIPPKAPTPSRNRQASQPGQQSHTSSPRSQKASTEISRSSASPASIAIPQTPAQGQPVKAQGPAPPLHHPQPSAPRSPLNNPGRAQYPFNMNGLPGLGVSGPPTSGPGMMQSMMPQMQMHQGPQIGHQARFAPNGMQYPPGFGGPRAFQPQQVSNYHPQGPAAQQPQHQIPKPITHSRQTSGSNYGDGMAQQGPISRPGPIARPSSATPERQKPTVHSSDPEVEQLTTQLGSKALLEDSDDPILSSVDTRNNLAPVGAPGSSRMPFSSPFVDSNQDTFNVGNQSWGGFNAGMPSTSGWGAPVLQRPAAGWGQGIFGTSGDAPLPIQRSHLPRPVAVRQMLVQACRKLSNMMGTNSEGFHPVQVVLQQLNIIKGPGDPPVPMDEMLGICDTEGNAQNGGGSFEVLYDKARGQIIKFVDDATAQPRSSVGDIGSPITTHNQSASYVSIPHSTIGPHRRAFGMDNVE